MSNCFFFIRCPMLTFNSPHFLPLLYLIIDCDLRVHALSPFLSFFLIRTHIHTHSHSLIFSPFLIFLSFSPVSYNASRFYDFNQSISHSTSRTSDRKIRVSITRSRYIYSGINGSDIVDNKLLCFTTYDHSLFAKWRNSV